ncbi:magnesium-translocating P-type ATPase [Ktedonosporobacter rubrisoli]|nr:magnesium-translocating P-type ATPase [Ktedonosporobacter rubrisoli]
MKLLTRTKQESARSTHTLRLSQLMRDVAISNTSHALQLLQTSQQGLTEFEANKRLAQFGKNEVAHEKPPVWWVQLGKAFVNPFIGVLVVLGTVSLFTDVIFASPEDRSWKEIIILSVMILISSLLRFWQEFRSQRSAEKLKAMVRTTATVIRRPSASHQEGHKREIPLADLVPGDIVSLSAGDMIPADVRLLTSKDLYISQSALTGEAMPVEKYDTLGNVVEKSAQRRLNTATDPLEISSLCFMGTNVVSGTATAAVVSTGKQTFFGSMASSVLGQRSMTSFDKGVNKVTWLLIRFMLIMVPVVFAINGLTKGDWQQAFFFALAVAVGLTPEMLPLVVTANLAKGAVMMAKHKVIVKRLNSIQNFGAMDILCTDKTGTLTEDHVVLVRHLDTRGQESEHVLQLAYVNSFYQTGLKNLIDRAVIEHAEEEHAVHTYLRYHKIDEIPFDFVRRRMSVIVEGSDELPLLICKGALEEILHISTAIEEHGQIVPLTEAKRARVQHLGNELNKDGLRVIAVAYKSLAGQHSPFAVSDEQDLVLAGYIGFLDPPKASSREAIQALSEHGVTVKILTGDNDIVTAKVCHEVGLDATRMVLGREIEDMSDEELTDLAEKTTVFAKLNPLQKARVIRCLKSNGHTVGYMGDGINDAAALRDADVGISVDTAVDIARESADMILLEKSLLVLEQGVIRGRVVFGNIIKYIKMTASSNFGNVFSVLVASAFIPFLPMLSIQLLIQNLLYDLSQLSLPWDRMDKEFVARPRKWEAGGLARFMVFIGPISSIFDITTFLLMWYVFKANSPEMQALFQSGWFIEGLLSQTLIVHMIRTQKIPFIQSIASLPVILLTGTIMAVGIAIPFTPFGASIGMQALPLSYFPWLVATLLTYCVLTQLIKTWFIRRFKVWL